MLDLHLEDMIIEVDTKWVGGTDDNWHNVEVRNDHSGDSYILGISADGFYTIEIDVDGSVVSLVGPSRSDRIRMGLNEVNSMRVSCIGTSLRLYVNGHLLAETTDRRLTGGAIGLSISSLAGEYSEVAFTNFVVRKPE